MYVFYFYRYAINSKKREQRKGNQGAYEGKGKHDQKSFEFPNPALLLN